MVKNIEIKVPTKGKYFLMDENYNFQLAIVNGKIYEREGKCCGCGKCCVALAPLNDDGKGICVFLDNDKCVLQKEGKKPIHCKAAPVFPDDPALLLEECTFKFIKRK